MLILGLLGMYFDAAVLFVTKSSLFFRLALAILWKVMYFCHIQPEIFGCFKDGTQDRNSATKS